VTQRGNQTPFTLCAEDQDYKEERGIEMLSSLKRWLKYLFLLTVPAILVTFFALEIVFRFAIPAANPPHAYFDVEDQIFRFDVNGPRAGKNTVGNLAQLQANWRVNNMGWMSGIDYVAQGREKPLIAIIGDSMIVALQVDVQDSLPSRLRSILENEFDVYSFGVSGAPLSQYLHMSRYVTETFDPDILVFNVVHNDFDQSLCDLWRPLGMMCLTDGNGKIRESGIVPYTPSKIRRWARKSSLVRYLALNLGLGTRFTRSAAEDDQRNYGSAGEQSQDPQPQRMERATDYILGKIDEETSGKTVIFMIDGLRESIYHNVTDERAGSEFWMNRLLESKASKYGFYFLDLTGPFTKSFEQNQLRFESKHDYIHWNENGHAIAAEALVLAIRETGPGRR
jgi:hypothetical protein